MAVVIAAATIFSISGGTKVVPVKAAVEVAEVLDLNENLRGQYGTLPEAFVAAQNGDTIRLLSDISDTSLTIGYNPVESGKHIILDLNGRNLTMNEVECDIFIDGQKWNNELPIDKWKYGIRI